jgi:hypothetical protein
LTITWYTFLLAAATLIFAAAALAPRLRTVSMIASGLAVLTLAFWLRAAGVL